MVSRSDMGENSLFGKRLPAEVLHVIDIIESGLHFEQVDGTVIRRHFIILVSIIIALREFILVGFYRAGLFFPKPLSNIFHLSSKKFPLVQEGLCRTLKERS